MRKLLLILVAIVPVAAQQTGNVTMRLFQGVPTGSCSGRELAKNTLTGDLWDCESNAWRLVSSSALSPPPAALAITPGQTLGNGILANPYNQAIAVTGGYPPYTATAISGALPAGVTVTSTAQGAQFTGTPTASGSFLFTLQICDSSSTCVFTAYTLFVSQSTPPPPPAVVILPGQVLSAATQGTPYSASIAATGGIQPYTVTLTGSFPPGLSIAATSSGAAISGAPTSSGTFAFGVQICDSETVPSCASGSFSISVAALVVSIPTQTCPAGFTGVVGYTCTISAQGAQTPYGWAVTSGTLPAGLTLATVSNRAVISGTPSTAGTSNFSLTVTAADATSQSISLTITISTPTACGFPNYACARTDYTIASISSLGVLPPNAGCQTLPCSTPHPCAANSSSAPMNLQNCGNLYGINQIITQANYANAKIVRVSDYQDLTIAGGCPGGAGIGGSANWNVFTSDSSYFAFGCFTGGVRIKWFNPATEQLNTSVNAAGFVVTSTGAIWSSSSAMLRASYIHPNTFYNIAFPQVVQLTISNGVMNSATTTVADLSLAVPCWNAIIHCGDWPGAARVVQPGANIVPLQHNSSPAHSFELINSASCTTGASYPNFLPATVYPVSMATPPFTGGTAGGRQSLQFWLQDGTCRWADMWIPPTTSIPWSAGFTTNVTDSTFTVAISNHQGQDSAGACFLVQYNATLNRYSHLNTCTGQVYNTTAGVRTYVGNVYDANTFPSGRENRIVMHGNTGFQNGVWVAVSSNFCALVSMTGDWTTYCPMGVATQGGAGPGWGSKPQPYYWQVGTSKLLGGFDWYGTGTPGHDNNGFNMVVFDNNVPYLQYGPSDPRGPNKFEGKVLTPAPILSKVPEYRYYDMSLQACTPVGAHPSTLIAPSPAAGQLTACFTPQISTAGVPNGVDQLAVNYDSHMSWVTNHGGDNEPMCQGTYGASGGATNFLWPPTFPWLGEVVCIFTNVTSTSIPNATMGANEKPPVREAFYYNSQTSVNFVPQFNVGSLSSDGGWWIFSSDWYCTLGTKTGGTSNVCGLPYQASHTYATAGELMGPIQLYSGVPGRIYKVITPGTTDATIQPAAFWCNTPATASIATPGCQITEGTAVFAYVGQANALDSMFIVKLQ